MSKKKNTSKKKKETAATKKTTEATKTVEQNTTEPANKDASMEQAADKHQTKILDEDTPTPDNQEDNKKLQDELAELKDKYLRKVAEFDNYKKRTLKERLELLNTAAQDTLRALLPILDNFDRAIQAGEDDSSKEPVSEGVKLVYRNLQTVLEQQGLKAMETNGELFDPEKHEALSEIPAPDENMKGKIIDTIEKGYTLKDKIIRYPRVIVGK